MGFDVAWICILGAMTPGPSLAMVLKHTINGGRNNGIAVGISHGLGVALYAVLTVFNFMWYFYLCKLMYKTYTPVLCPRSAQLKET